jgi:predicted transcriptional regulator
MMQDAPFETSDPIALATDVVAAFVANNALPLAELPALIQSVHGALVRLAGTTLEQSTPETPAPLPAVSIRNSIKPDYLICLDDGRKFKALKRHLSALGMTPDQYRAKWNLPPDYPMTAPNYAAARAALAKKAGLGQHRQLEVGDV